MKIDVIYRGCEKETTPETVRGIRPSWFDKRKCFKSVWNLSVADPETFSIHVIYDGGPSPLLDYIKTMRVSDGAIRQVEYGSYASMEFQWEYADTLKGDWIYFVEDDYLHGPSSARVLLEGAAKFDLLTLYDHLDRYTRTDDITRGMESVALTASTHWRTGESTCTTWAASRELWNDIKALAKERGASDRHFFQDLVRRNIRLWQPIPGHSTHCFQGYMSPLVDWYSVADDICL